MLYFIQQLTEPPTHRDNNMVPTPSLLFIRRYLVIFCLLCFLPACAFSPTQTPPWNEQYTLAYAQAQHILPQSSLYNVTASPPVLPTDASYLIQQFNFVDASGKTATITFNDNAIKDSIEARCCGSITPWANDNSLYINTAISTVKLSANEALQKSVPTKNDILSQNQLKEPDIHVIIGLQIEPEVQEVFQLPAAWSVLYLTRNNGEFRVWIHPQNGDVLGIAYNTMFP